ncbi:hypothetical protein PUW24_16235 [Paenibacillus urinalis]|uniref:DUF4878 domain-containing protein n=1 Tax=Paenibacillus urinalis TaxID=521520 RepID=A0ABY7XDT8_9BACL|nr:hypothetical protein [Paenibacillus urinalis]WDH95749.1 hypothetical protein PUW24_16235 [Paenibacillus urinalis]WDI03946.1 hypothetical protein PUW25_08355 [Paenibacillus urinalis]
MRKIGLTATMILALLMLVGCGADATDNSDGGAKAKVTQLVKESIGDQYGPEVAKTVKVHFSSVKEGVTDGRMFLDGSTEFTWKHEGMKKTWDYTKSFQYELQHNGTEWTIRNKMFFDEERTERK